MANSGDPAVVHRRAPALPPSLPRPTFPRPPDRDPTTTVNPSRVKRTAYRSAPGFLLKSPCPFRFLTRGPNQCKSNYIQALFYSLRPLNFPSFEPTVHQAAALDFLHATPCVYLLFMYRSLVFAENPWKLCFSYSLAPRSCFKRRFRVLAPF